jgi:crotonobetainyl-CoA:carnitine CoA-transferase CaiB-like acyl-CoA transferase
MPVSGAGESPVLPLQGVRVLDLATVLAAPFAATLLAEFGADVIKVEQPGVGDPVRGFEPSRDGKSLYWMVTNRNKRSITLDLHTADGRELLLRLVEQVDIVVTNFRPAKLAEWRIDFADLKAVNPKVILFHLTAFGRSGPYSGRPGFARVAEAMAGLTYTTGYADRPPVFSGYPLADGIGGIYGAFSIMLALRHRDLTGEPQLIDIALYEPLLRLTEDIVVGYSGTGAVKERHGNENPNIAPNNVYPTADGKYVILPVSTERMWSRLVDLLDDDELRRFGTNAIRLANRRVIDERITKFTMAHTLDEVMAVFSAHDIPHGKIYTAEDIVADPQIRHRNNLVTIHDEELGADLTVQAPVPSFSAFTPRITPAPKLGEHNGELYRELLGLDEPTIREYADRGVI